MPRRRPNPGEFVLDSGKYGPDEADNDPGFVGWVAEDGRRTPLEPHERRNRKSEYPWDDAFRLTLARLMLCGMPTKYQHARPQQQIIGLLGDAFEKLGVKPPGRSMLAEQAKAFHDNWIAVADRHWGRSKKR
jgi:hypothetical protein